MEPNGLSEPVLNDLLRRVDWRFLLGGEDLPRVLNLASGREREAVALVGEDATPGEADLAVLGRPGAAALSRARRELRPGGAVVCRSRLPLPGAAALVRARLHRAGFGDARLLWPGPIPFRTPQFWLPLDNPGAAHHLLMQRPAQGAGQRLLRLAWRAAVRLGALAPVYAIARAPGTPPEPDGSRDQLSMALPSTADLLLLTGGMRSINKVVGFPFGPGMGDEAVVVKFGRVAAADAALGHEAEALRALERQRPALSGFPRVQAVGRRCGQVAVVEAVVAGEPLIERLSPATLPALAEGVTDWLLAVAGDAPALPTEASWPRLVGEPLGVFERQFGEVIGAEALGRLREMLTGLGPLPEVFEHRDCSPWNVLVTEQGGTALLDWESAEPRGLPALDLVYFLANAAFVIDGALDAGDLGPSYVRLLDPATPTGAVAASSLRRYSERLGIDAATLHRLRLLCWVVHCQSDYRHLEMAAAGPPTVTALRTSGFLALVERELRQHE
jgi:hypothetical protein